MREVNKCNPLDLQFTCKINYFVCTEDDQDKRFFKNSKTNSPFIKNYILYAGVQKRTTLPPKVAGTKSENDVIYGVFAGTL